MKQKYSPKVVLTLETLHIGVRYIWVLDTFLHVVVKRNFYCCLWDGIYYCGESQCDIYPKIVMEMHFLILSLTMYLLIYRICLIQ